MFTKCDVYKSIMKNIITKFLSICFLNLIVERQEGVLHDFHRLLKVLENTETICNFISAKKK